MLKRSRMTSPRQMSIADISNSAYTEQTITNSSEAGSQMHGPVDITLYTLSIGLFVSSCYVFLVMCIYLHRFLRKRRHSQAKITSSVLANGFGKLGICMRFVTAFISLLCFVHFILEQILLHSDCCSTAMEKASQLIYGFVIIFSYVFFWLRQRVLYDAPAMRLFSNKLLRILSWLSLALLILNSVAQIVLTCLLGRIANPVWVYLSWLLGCLIVQGALMSLFLYPLQKHGNERRKIFAAKRKKTNTKRCPKRTLTPSESNGVEDGIRDSNIFTVCSSRGSNGSTSSVRRSTLASANPMYRATRRCVVCAAVAFLTDVIAGVYMILADCNNWNSHEAVAAKRFLFDLNLVVNSTFVVGCYANWRYILLPDGFRLFARHGERYLPPMSTSDESVQQQVFPNHHCYDDP